MGNQMPNPPSPSFKDLEDKEPKELWEVYSSYGKGIKAHIQAKTAKEAIEKFEMKFRETWIDKPYPILSVVYLGTLTK